MGQRHQIYVRLPGRFYNEGNPNNRPERTIGIHAQWLYGTLPVRRLDSLFRFLQKQDADYCPLRRGYRDQTDTLNTLYSVDHIEGYYAPAHNLGVEECANPLLGDNNDGITIIDLTGKRPAYCFMHLDSYGRNKGKAYKPLTAAQYMATYYGDQLEGDHAPRDAMQILVRFEHCQAKLLSAKRVREIFPEMFAALPAHKREMAARNRRYAAEIKKFGK